MTTTILQDERTPLKTDTPEARKAVMLESLRLAAEAVPTSCGMMIASIEAETLEGVQVAIFGGSSRLQMAFMALTMLDSCGFIPPPLMKIVRGIITARVTHEGSETVQ